MTSSEVALDEYFLVCDKIREVKRLKSSCRQLRERKAALQEVKTG